MPSGRPTFFPRAGSRILVFVRRLVPSSRAVIPPSHWPVRTVVGRGWVVKPVERQYPLYLNKIWSRQIVRKNLTNSFCPRRRAFLSCGRVQFIAYNRIVTHGSRTTSQANSIRQPISALADRAVTSTVSRLVWKLPREEGLGIMPRCSPNQRQTSLFIEPEGTSSV